MEQEIIDAFKNFAIAELKIREDEINSITDVRPMFDGRVKKIVRNETCHTNASKYHIAKLTRKYLRKKNPCTNFRIYVPIVQRFPSYSFKSYYNVKDEKIWKSIYFSTNNNDLRSAILGVVSNNIVNEVVLNGITIYYLVQSVVNTYVFYSPEPVYEENDL